MDYLLLLHQFDKRHEVAAWPRQRVLHECLRAAILDGRLAAGTRLASSRALAAELAVSRNTVIYAYEQLGTEGFLQQDRRGTVVAALSAARPAPTATSALPAALSKRAQTIVGIGVPNPIVTGFAPGVPALDEFPMRLWRRLLERAWKDVGSGQLNYGDAAGEPVLRRAIAEYLTASRGARCDARQVFITAGTQHSLDICAQAFADPGATAWIENPGYTGALLAFRAAQLKAVPIRVDDEGIAPQASHWQRTPPRLIYTSPSHQYPTGGVLSLPRRLQLLDDARRAGALIIEDDYDSEFRHDGPPLPAMQGLADNAPVLYLGTFSKTMFPALRIGYLVVPLPMADALAAWMARMAPQGRPAEQLALAEFLRNGQFARHLRRMRRIYRERRDATVEAIERRLGALVTVHGASAGMHLALRLNARYAVDSAIAAAARDAGIAAKALSDHATGARAHGWNGFLIGYTQVPVDAVDALVARLGAIVERELG